MADLFGIVVNLGLLLSASTWIYVFAGGVETRACPDVPSIENGKLMELMTAELVTALVVCDIGYVSTKEYVECLASGEWETVECLPIDCGQVPLVDHGEVVLTNSTNTKYGATAQVVCDVGYIPTDESLKCMDSGLWEDWDSMAQCNIIGCGPTPNITNGEVALEVSGNSTYGAIAHVTCENGLSPLIEEIVCQANGAWVDEEPFEPCSATECEEVPSVDHGQVVLEDGSAGIARVECDLGYTPLIAQLSCLPSGQWQDWESAAMCIETDLGEVWIEAGEELSESLHTTFLKCSFSVSDGLMYRINWFYDGIEFNDTGILPAAEVIAFRIQGEDVPGIVSMLNARITCMASVYDSQGIELLENKTSTEFFPIEISTTDITMTRGQTFTFTIFVNLKFGCPPTSSECALNFLLFDPNDSYDCLDSTIAVVSRDTCGGKVFPSEIGTPKNITITTKNNWYYRLRSDFTLWLMASAVGNAGHIWNQKLGELKVHVDENYLTRYRACYAFVDPYMYTLDRRYYSNQLIEHFVMFRHKTLPIEVQTITAPCNWNRATCSCAVTVRAGGDVFTINHCGGGHQTKYLSYNDGILKVYRLFTNFYRIILPTGMHVYAYVMSYFDYTMNVFIIPSQSDFDQVEGLCGNYNGDRDDDTTLRDTDLLDDAEFDKGSNGYWRSNYYYPHDFARSWGLHDTHREDESLLNPDIYENVVNWDEDKKRCVCPNLLTDPSPVSLCSADEEGTCQGSPWRYGTLIRPTRTTTTDNKRDVEREHFYNDNTARRLARMKRNWEESREHFSHQILKRQAGNTTLEDAEAICVEELNKCNAYTKKDDVEDVANSDDNLENCARDVAIDGTATWTSPHCDAYTQKVSVELEKDVDFAENHADLVQDIKDNSCPGNCSGHGDCVEGVCECYDGFGTDLCLLDLAVPPVVEEFGDDGVCDVSSGDTCDFILIVGDGFVEDPACNVTSYSIESDGSQTMLNYFTTTCEFLNFNEILAPTTDVSNGTRRRREAESSTTSFATMYGIQVSNDGVNFGTPQYVVVLDTTCQETDANTTLVTLKPGHCYISGTCYSEGTYRVGSSCDRCDTSDSFFHWTDVCISDGSPSDDETQLGIIIGSVLGAVVVLAIGAVVSLYLYKKTKRPAVLGESWVSNTHFWNKKNSIGSTFDPPSQGLLDSKKGRKMSVGISGAIGTDPMSKF